MIDDELVRHAGTMGDLAQARALEPRGREHLQRSRQDAGPSIFLAFRRYAQSLLLFASVAPKDY